MRDEHFDKNLSLKRNHACDQANEIFPDSIKQIKTYVIFTSMLVKYTRAKQFEFKCEKVWCFRERCNCIYVTLESYLIHWPWPCWALILGNNLEHYRNCWSINTLSNNKSIMSSIFLLYYTLFYVIILFFPAKVEYSYFSVDFKLRIYYNPFYGSLDVLCCLPYVLFLTTFYCKCYNCEGLESTIYYCFIVLLASKKTVFAVKRKKVLLHLKFSTHELYSFQNLNVYS